MKSDLANKQKKKKTKVKSKEIFAMNPNDPTIDNFDLMQQTTA